MTSRKIYKFIQNADIVEGPDDLWPIGQAAAIMMMH
jgi:hypothetical protein